MMKKYVLAIDESTTSSRSVLFDKNGNVIAVAQRRIYATTIAAAFIFF